MPSPQKQAEVKRLKQLLASGGGGGAEPAAAMPPATKPVKDQPAAAKPTLLASHAAEKAATRYRALDPAAWSRVVDDVGGLDEVLESIRRRIWVPLCARSAAL